MNRAAAGGLFDSFQNWRDFSKVLLKDILNKSTAIPSNELTETLKCHRNNVLHGKKKLFKESESETKILIQKSILHRP